MINDSNMGSAPGGRSEAFQSGVRGPGNHGPIAPSLMAEQSKWNMAAAQHHRMASDLYTPSSVLTANSVVPSQSGYSAADYANRVTPSGVLPSPNGMSQQTYHTLNTTQFATRLQI